MNKKITFFIIWAVLATGTVFSTAVKTKAALPNIQVQFQTNPLFNSTNFAPGNTTTGWIKITNNYPDSRMVAIKTINIVDTGALAAQINFVIKTGVTVIYSGTLQDIINAGEKPLTALAGGSTIQYDFTATFNPSAGNHYQGKTVGFDLLSGFQTQTQGTISGMKFNDLNRNGVKDANEPGLQGWSITLHNTGNGIIRTAITDASGNYSFTNLPAGSYKIREVHQKGWKRISKNPKAITITNGSNITGTNFGNVLKKNNESEDTDTDDLRDE